MASGSCRVNKASGEYYAALGKRSGGWMSRSALAANVLRAGQQYSHEML
jgi:hypothetical protein